MQSKRDGLVPIGEAFSDLSGPVAAIRDATPQAVYHFTQADQVNLLVGASEADPDLGFMARMMALCSLPRTNPGQFLFNSITFLDTQLLGRRLRASRTDGFVHPQVLRQEPIQELGQA